MTEIENQFREIVEACKSLPAAEQGKAVSERLEKFLVDVALNPTGDDPLPVSPDTLASLLPASAPPTVREAFETFVQRAQLLQAAREPLSAESRGQIASAIHALAEAGHVHDYLADKFRVSANRQFLDRALANAGTAWQLAMVANWALNETGRTELASTAWAKELPGSDPGALVTILSGMLRFEHVASLRDYRRQAMRHVPRLTGDEFSTLLSARWRDVIEQPSGREAVNDIPLVTPFTKQGDIEYSLYRHYLIPDLATTIRRGVPEIGRGLALADKDIDVLFSLPIVIQQAEQEIYNHVKDVIDGVIQSWARQCRQRHDETGDALRIAERLWDFRRSPAASDCSNPVENLAKGFNATIRNSFSHFSDINIAASSGDRIDPFDVADKFILFASVSNGQLDNLAEAHRQYCANEANPANWDNEAFFSHFLAANRHNDLCHIQGHFLIDKTRGCPAIPRIPHFHGIVMDLVLEFAYREFGEQNLRQAGSWYLREKTPGGAH